MSKDKTEIKELKQSDHFNAGYKLAIEHFQIWYETRTTFEEALRRMKGNA